MDEEEIKMDFVIFYNNMKVAEVATAKLAALVAELFGAGTEVYHKRLKQLAQIDVSGQAIDPEHLEREAGVV